MLLMFAAGWGIGSFYKKPFVPKNEIFDECNWLSKYDLYNYEDSILKYGDLRKLNELLPLCNIEKYPYLIVMYDVHHRNVSYELYETNNKYLKGWRWRNKKVLKPMNDFVKSVLTEYAEADDELAQKALKELNEDERYQ